MAGSIGVPCVLMRGGTSRAAFFLRTDLPSDPRRRDAVLVAAMEAGHELQVDGIGGGSPLTSKVAIVGPSTRPDADIDYLFAQVGVRERSVDLSPICGNVLTAVGPFAIEAALAAANDGTTTVRVHNVNTGKIVEAEVATPGHLRGRDRDRRRARDRGGRGHTTPIRPPPRPVGPDRAGR